MNVAEVLALIEAFAPRSLQESYDNSGLQVGDLAAKVNGALLTLDVTEAVLDEALARNCNVIIAHHPLIFSGLKQISERNYVQRIVRRAIKNDINIIAVHTNLDNVAQGVNARIAQKLGLQDTRVLQPLGGKMLKLAVMVPDTHADLVSEALFAAGAGKMGAYTECSFRYSGTGTFKPGAESKPFIGESNGARENVAETKLEFILPDHLAHAAEKALRGAHPYEEPAFDIFRLENRNAETGSGMIGRLTNPMPEHEFLQFLKTNMKAQMVRYTAPRGKTVETVAVCGGSGSFLLPQALAAGADAFVTADFKYHQFFDAEGKIMICDIGHYETEQFTPEIFAELITKKNVTFAVLLSTLDTNPVKYF